MSAEIAAARLIGRRVFALNGRPIGRLQEIGVEVRGDECYVTEYLVGIYGVFERLAASDIGRTVLRTLGAQRKAGYRVPWQALDLTDPEKPRLRCPVSDLEPLPGDE